MKLDQIIPDPNIRKRIYQVFGALGLVLTGTQAGFAAVQAEQPAWLTVAFAVYGVFAVAGFATASANTEQGAITQVGEPAEPIRPLIVSNPDAQGGITPEVPYEPRHAE